MRQSTDMEPEVVAEIKDAISTVVDKCLAAQNWEVTKVIALLKFYYSLMIFFEIIWLKEASKQLKVILDKKFGAPWQVAIGEGFEVKTRYLSNYF